MLPRLGLFTKVCKSSSGSVWENCSSGNDASWEQIIGQH